MDTKATWEDWATRLVSAATIAALGYFVLFVDFTNQGRIWDKLAAHVPVLARIIPPQASSPGTVIVKGGAGMEQVPLENRTLIAGEAAPQAAAPQAPAQEPQAPAQAAAKAPAPRLNTSLSGFDIHSSPSQTSARLDASAAAQPAAPAQGASAASAAETEPRSAIAAKASYGAASRSEMMGQAAGPVYNLKGKSKKR
ncbi:MAG: hypothetical protein HY926_08195 [Elusimicrobia bacterium]|nr:hypothetical protein [Elusimicrobiota bacterium]